MIKEKEKLPKLELEGTDGKTYTQESFNEKSIIFIYPKDNTPGCTKEVCGFRDHYEQIKKTQYKLFGLSPDKISKHHKFIEQQKLPFILLSDPTKENLERLGALKEKSMFGKKYLGVQRSTIIIDEQGQIEKVYEKVKPETHAQEILTYIHSKN